MTLKYRCAGVMVGTCQPDDPEGAPFEVFTHIMLAVLGEDDEVKPETESQKIVIKSKHRPVYKLGQVCEFAPERPATGRRAKK